MSETGDPGRPEVSDLEPNSTDGTASVEAYSTEDGTVLYDAANPLAWIESTGAVRLDEAH